MRLGPGGKLTTATPPKRTAKQAVLPAEPTAGTDRPEVPERRTTTVEQHGDTRRTRVRR